MITGMGSSFSAQMAVSPQLLPEPPWDRGRATLRHGCTLKPWDLPATAPGIRVLRVKVFAALPVRKNELSAPLGEGMGMTHSLMAKQNKALKNCIPHNLSSVLHATAAFGTFPILRLC